MTSRAGSGTCSAPEVVRRATGCVGALWVALLVFSGGARAQAGAYRFVIDSVADSTITFNAAGEHWVKAGLHGIAVDPQRHDALVARFAILSVHDGQAVALITGQTTQLSNEHVALVERPGTPFFKRAGFWIGLALGTVSGIAIAR